MVGLPGQIQQLDRSYKCVMLNSNARIRGGRTGGRTLQIVSYICQVVVIFSVIVACLINLTLNDDKAALWSSLLLLALGCMLPNPKLRRDVKQHQFLPSPSIQLQSPILSEQHDDSIHDSSLENGRTDGRRMGMRIGGNDVSEDVVHDT